MSLKALLAANHPRIYEANHVFDVTFIRGVCRAKMLEDIPFGQSRLLDWDSSYAWRPMLVSIGLSARSGIQLRHHRSCECLCIKTWNLFNTIRLLIGSSTDCFNCIALPSTFRLHPVTLSSLDPSHHQRAGPVPEPRNYNLRPLPVCGCS